MKLSMGIIKFEVSVPEAFRAIAAFRQDRRAALEQFSHQVQSAAADVINRLLQAEMTLFLGSPDQIGNKRNGYADRDYVLKGIGAIRTHAPSHKPLLSALRRRHVLHGATSRRAAFAELTARCWVHAMMNAMAKTPQRFRPTFKKLADDVMYARGEDDARKAFLKPKSVMANDATRAVACLEKDLDSLVAHYAFHPSLWRALKTTNAIERVHREFKRRTKSMDSLGERTLQVVVAFTAIRMEFNRQKIPVDSKVINNFLHVKKHFLDMPTDLNIN